MENSGYLKPLHSTLTQLSCFIFLLKIGEKSFKVKENVKKSIFGGDWTEL